MSFKKKYTKSTIINYTHAMYYKKTIKALDHANYISNSLNKILSFRKRKVNKNLLLTTNAVFKKKLLFTITSKPYFYNSALIRGLRLRRPTIRVKSSNIYNPISYLYNTLTHDHYYFLKKNYLNSKMGRNSFKKYLSTKVLLKGSKYINLSYNLENPLNCISTTRQSSSSTIKLKNNYNGLILKNSPLYINYKFSLSSDKLLNFKVLIKKSIFSFLKPNQIRKSLMLRRQKITYFRFFNRLNKKDLSLKFLLSNYGAVYKGRQLNIPYSNYSSLAKLSFYSYNAPFYSSFTGNLFLQKFPSYEEFRGELHVPRVRFKPGYQKLWRDSRSTLAEALKVRYTYQQQFTKYIARFNRKLNSYHFSRDEYTVSTIFLYSRIISDYNTLILLNNSNCVFVNGRANTNLDLILFVGDSVQLLISNWMYIYLKWVNMWTSNRVKKFRKLVYRKNLASSYRIMKSRKQKSNYTPLWIHQTKYDISDIKPFLETDFFTLSSILIYDNFLFDFYTPSWFIEDRQLIYRLYNWKYIT